MNPLRQKMALFLTDAARKGLKSLDPKSQCAKILRKSDFENILREDVNRICEATSFIEITKTISLTAQLQRASEEKRKAIKDELKKIAEDVVKRIEKKSGKLKMPKPCRHLLLNL